MSQFHYRESPFPPAHELRGYGEIDPTYPDMIMAMSSHALNRNLEDQGRSVWAESFSVIASSLAVPLVGIASLAATVWLGVSGHPGPALGTAVPAVGITISQVIITASRSKKHPDDD